MLLEKSEVFFFFFFFFFFFQNKTNAIPHSGFYSSAFVYSHFFLKDSVYLLFAYCLVHYLREVFWNLGLHQIARIERWIERKIFQGFWTHEEIEFHNLTLSFHYRLPVVEKCLEKCLLIVDIIFFGDELPFIWKC